MSSHKLYNKEMSSRTSAVLDGNSDKSWRLYSIKATLVLR